MSFLKNLVPRPVKNPHNGIRIFLPTIDLEEIVNAITVGREAIGDKQHTIRIYVVFIGQPVAIHTRQYINVNSGLAPERRQTSAVYAVNDGIDAHKAFLRIVAEYPVGSDGQDAVLHSHHRPWIDMNFTINIIIIQQNV